MSVCLVSHLTSSILAFFFVFFALEQFKDAINDEDFEDLPKDAQADPKGVVAQDLLKNLLPFLNISGRQVPWGNAGRNSEVTKLMAEHRWYGPGSHFVNLAPGDVHNRSAVRLCHPFVGYDQAPAQVGDGPRQRRRWWRRQRRQQRLRLPSHSARRNAGQPCRRRL